MARGLFINRDIGIASLGTIVDAVVMSSEKNAGTFVMNSVSFFEKT